MCRMGCLAGSFTFLHKLFLCLLRAYFQQTSGTTANRSFPFFAGCNYKNTINHHTISFRVDPDPTRLLPKEITAQGALAPRLDSVVRVHLQVRVPVPAPARERLPAVLQARAHARRTHHSQLLHSAAR